MFRFHHGAWPPHSRIWLRFGVLLPVGLAACAVLFSESGLDAALSALFYDGARHQFLISTGGWIELIGHRVGKFVVLTCWLLLAATGFATFWIPGLAAHRRLAWTLVLAMALGPGAVTLLKAINSHPCPWSLKEFGGTAENSASWFVSRIEAGQCFPGGHAAGGFSIVALGFAGAVLRRPRLCRGGLSLGLGVGTAFSILQVAKGAHFMSHNLWAGAIDLWLVALVFSPLMVPQPAARSNDDTDPRGSTP